MNEIFGKLLYDINEYEEDIEISEGHRHNLKNTLKKIELYLASKFLSGNRDSQGNKKYFYNLILPQCGNATKNIDLDRKDIVVTPVRGLKDSLKALVYKSELNYWMRKENIGLLLNKISDALPKYGSVILKKVKDDVLFVPLRNIMFDPAVSNCPDDYDLNSPYVIEKHVYQPIELEAMTEFNQKEVKRLVEESKNQPIEVYEYYSTFKDDEIGLGNTGKYIKARVYLGKLEVKEKDGTMKPDGVILKKEKVSSFPYKKLDYFTIEGRALGLGIAEMLFDVQERWNEMANDKAVSMRLGNKQLFQTRDTSTAGNILTDLLNGDILQVNSEITKIDTSERNLQAYGQEENNMLYHVRSLANAQEVLTGEALPSRTPFRSLALQQQSAGKLFEFIRQNIGMFLEEVFIEWVLPMFDKNVIKEHTFRMYEPEDILQIVEADINSRINESIKKYVIQTGYFPTQEEIDIIKADLKSREGKQKELFLDIIEGWLDFDYDIQIDITGEKINKQAEVETGINILQLLAQNPQAMSDERFMKLIQYIATSSGLDPMVIPSGSPAEVPTAGEMGAGSMNPTASIPNASMPQQPSN
jgi:hypothetical protein